MAVTLRELLVRIDANTSGLKKGLNDGEKQLDHFSNVAKNVGRTMLGVFAVDRVFSYIKSIVQTTAEFEKLEAVLTSTLGSSSMAQKSFELIAKFAAKTPFSVQEVTQSFVKLANRGVVPAYHQLERMADVASVLGKPFEQLVEAILDVSNSKRWTELGIKAENAGDKVRLTFRGVTKEVERTEAGVLGAIESFGNMQGVFGVTAKVAETTAGKLGELGDNALFLQKNLGDSQSGLIHGLLEAANVALGAFNRELAEANKQAKELAMAKLLSPDDVKAELKEAGYGDGIIADGNAVQYALEAVDRKVLQAYRNIHENGKLLIAAGDDVATMEWKMQSLQAALETQKDFKYFDLLKRYADEDLAALNKAVMDQNKSLEATKEAQLAAKEASEARYKKEIELAKQLFNIEKEARASEKEEDFVMPDLTVQGTDYEKYGLNAMDAIRAGLIQPFEHEWDASLLKVADGFQAIADGNAMDIINKDLEKTNKLLEGGDQKTLKMAESAEYWGNTLTNIFEAMITDGSNAFQILTDAIKKLLIRLAAAAAATAVISAFTGGAGGAIMSSMGGFGGLFSRLAGVPAFAEGGLVSGPTLGLVGEGAGTSRSNPEVIAPLSDLKGMMGGMMGGQLVAKVSGSDLLFILERAQRDYNR